jgi:chromosome segregation ATPase
MLTLRYLLTCPEPDILELFVSDFFLLSQQTRMKKIESTTARATKSRETEMQLNEATTRIHEQDAELGALKASYAALSQKYEEETAYAATQINSARKLAKLKSRTTEMKTENATLSEMIQSQKVVIHELKQENRVLSERLDSRNKMTEEREEYTKVMRARIEEGGHTDFAFRAAEERLEETGNQLVDSSQKIARLEAELRGQIEGKRVLEAEVCQQTQARRSGGGSAERSLPPSAEGYQSHQKEVCWQEADAGGKDGRGREGEVEAGNNREVHNKSAHNQIRNRTGSVPRGL